MIDKMMERINRARKEAQKSEAFLKSAEQHAEAISSFDERENEPFPLKRRKRRKKAESFAMRYREYYQGSHHDPST